VTERDVTPRPPRKLRVGVIFGGRSGEHEVSLASARSVIAAMNPERYEMIPIGITKEGAWIATGDPMLALASGLTQGDTMPAALLPDPARQAVLELSRPSTLQLESVLRASPLDVVFPVLHGPFGEDGTVQGLLELANIPYVGAGVMASAVSMDKAIAREIFAARGFPMARYLMVKRKRWDQEPDAVLQDVETQIGYPCFVKPSSLGSSVGISKVHAPSEMRSAMDLAASFDRKILVEEAVNAREIEVSVLGNDEPVASAVGEIIPCREFYDYRAKYVDDRSELLIPAPIPDDLARRIRQMAIQVYLAVDSAGLGRVDFLLDRDSGAFYVNEINTMPGFTAISMYPKLWEATGISYPELIDRLIDLALERHADKNRSRTDYAVESD
jgi:D-alanine-D-alanine ligase